MNTEERFTKHRERFDKARESAIENRIAANFERVAEYICLTLKEEVTIDEINQAVDKFMLGWTLFPQNK